MPVASLTSREEQVRALVVDGLGTDGVAEQLGISRRTVETHLRNVYKKLGVHRREELGGGHRELLEGAPAYEDEVRRLEEKLAARDRQVESYEAAVERIIDRQFPLFEERVELTVVVGTKSSEDRIVQRHWTTPKPYLVYRVIRPIAAHSGSHVPPLDSMAIACEVAQADVGIAVEIFSDKRGRPVAIILFQPGLEQPTEWVLRYRTPGLWDPLRETGVDRLRWAAGRLDGRFADAIDGLRVEFVFPDEAENTEVVEEHGGGKIIRHSDSRVEYLDDTRTGGIYEWCLKMEVRPMQDR